MTKALKSFCTAWGGYLGLFVATSRCPCCGQPLCPRGTAVMALLAAVAALVSRWLRKGAPKKGVSSPLPPDTTGDSARE